MVLLQRRDYSKMAASLLTKLERQFECELCLESLNDPRELVCRHAYCRSCLEDLLKFDSNGNATIKCPYNCVDTTFIGSNDTTKILRKNRELLKILDLMKEENRSQTTIGTTCNCKASISKWCTGCRLMFCKNCYQTHDCINKSCINGYYSFAKETFQPLCKHHDAHIKHICLDCDHRFICCYCCNRDHRSHQVNTLEESANKYKQGYLDDLDKINGDDLDFSYDDVITNVFKFEEDLTMELNSRIHLKVSSYIQKLNKEKEEILSQYKQAASNYKLSLNGLQFSHQTIKESLDSAKKSLKQQSPFETLALKANLIRQIESITKLNVFKVSIDEDENSDSLGTLQTAILEKDLSEENVAFDHDINLKSKDDYVDILNESKFLIEDLQKKSTRLLITNVEEKYYLQYNTKDINALISNNDIQTLKKIILLNPKSLSDSSFRSIYLLIQNNQSDVLNLLLKHYPDAVDIKGDNNNSPLLYAVKEGRTECVKKLLQNYANIHVRDEYNNTCLHTAASHGHHEIINILLNHGADINSKGYEGATPLMYAARYGHKECVNILLQNNADINLRDDKLNEICLHQAAHHGHHEIISILLKHDVDINSKGYNGDTPLIKAAIYGQKECANILLQRNADVNLKDDDNNTCLHFEAANGHHEIIKILLNHGADINSKNTKEETPLLKAVMKGHSKCVKILLENNADVNIRDKENGPPLFWAIMGGDKIIQDMLRHHKAT